MDNWLNLNKRPCWDSIPDPFASEANPYHEVLDYTYPYSFIVLPEILSFNLSSDDSSNETKKKKKTP